MDIKQYSMVCLLIVSVATIFVFSSSPSSTVHDLGLDTVKVVIVGGGLSGSLVADILKKDKENDVILIPDKATSSQRWWQADDTSKDHDNHENTLYYPQYAQDHGGVDGAPIISATHGKQKYSPPFEHGLVDGVTDDVDHVLLGRVINDHSDSK